MKIMIENDKRVPIRMLTPRECLRLMGFRDPEIDKLVEAYPKTRLYAFAGDAVVVDVFEGVIKTIFREVGA